MITSDLFNKKTNESLADEFMKIARDKGYNPRLRGTPDEERARTDAMLKQRAADRANAPKSSGPSDEERAKLQAALKSLEAEFDPDYDYSDDYRHWSKHNNIKKQINSIKNQLKSGLTESVFLREDRRVIYEQWNRVGQHLVEYKLTPDQIQDLFNRVEQKATAAGGNRTMVGRGVDKAAELNNAWEVLKDKIQNSRPIKGFDNLYDQAAAKLKSATGGDEGVMQYVNKYRAFAKEHPYIQSAVYAALIAAAGLSGAGLGGAGALGLLKMTDRLLQGDKASSALYKGAKTGALAMAAHSIADYFKNPSQPIPPGTPARLPDGSEYIVQKGDTLSQIAQKNGVSVKDLMQANAGQAVPSGEVMTFNQPDAFSDVNAMGDAVPSSTGTQMTYDVRPKLTNPDVLSPGQKLNIPGSLGPTQTYADGVGTAADTWDKVKSGEYSPSEISRNQAAKYNLPGAGEYRPTGGAASAATDTAGAASKASDAASSVVGNKASAASTGDETNYAASKTNPWEKANAKVDAEVAKTNADAAADAAAKNAKASAEYSDWLAKNPGSPVPYDDEGKLMPGWVNDPEKPGYLKFNAPKLKESQIYSLFDSVVARQRRLNEGVLDTIKGAAGKAADWAKTKGHNITTKITLDKLLQAWNKAGKPTDSDQIKKILQGAGVDDQVISGVYADMKIPATAAAPAQQPAATTPVAKPAATAARTTTPQAGATPSWADPKSGEYVGRREVARRMAAQPAKTATPQWTSASGVQPSSVKYTTSKTAQPTAAPTANTGKLSSQEYIRRIGAPNLPEAAAENKKKDNDDLGAQVKDVALQRAIGRAKADFPTAGSGLEALAKDFMRSQDADQKALDQLRQAERKQDQMLSQISKIDQEQEQEINDLEQQNSTLAQRLQKLQSVNTELEKKLAAMSGRRERRQADKAKTEPTSSTVDIGIPVSAKSAPKNKPKTDRDIKKAKKYKDAVVKSIKADPRGAASRMLARPEEEPELEPGAQAFDQMTPQLGQQQKELFPSDYGQDSANLARQQILKGLRDKATDVDYRMLKDPEALQKVAQKELVSANENKEKEADYGDKYQAMVQRVGQKAREQEKKHPVDVKDLARRLAAVKLKDEK